MDGHWANFHDSVREKVDKAKKLFDPLLELLPDEPILKKRVNVTQPAIAGRAMPLWSSEDTRNAVLASLIPGGTALLGASVYLIDKPTAKWWGELRKPSWLTDQRMHVASVLDIATLLPVGYASYLCYKHGGGFDYNDTRLALAVYGANIAFVGACVPLVRKKNLSCLVKNIGLVHGSAVLAAILFFRIHKPAGLWMIPYALWSGFYVFMMHSIEKENDPVKNL